MSIAHNDSWLWIGLGCFTAFTIYVVYSSRSDLLHLSEVHVDAGNKKDDQKHWEVNQETEDRVSAEALFELAKSSTNIEIRKSAAKILFERMLHDEAAIASLRSDALSSFNTSSYRSYKNLGALADSFHDPHPRQLLDATIAPRSTITDLTTPAAALLPAEATPVILNLINSLRERGLTANADQAPANAIPESRPVPSISGLEQELRRRRREAIVLNEGDRPVTQEDIIQRRGTGELNEMFHSATAAAEERAAVAPWRNLDGAAGMEAQLPTDMSPEFLTVLQQGLALMAQGVNVVETLQGLVEGDLESGGGAGGGGGRQN